MLNDILEKLRNHPSPGNSQHSPGDSHHSHGDPRHSHESGNLNSHPLILTPSKHLAEHWREQMTPHIDVVRVHPLSDWLAELWRNYNAAKHLLTEHQALSVWADIIKRSPQGTLILQPLKTAALVQEAWTSLHQWGISLDALKHSLAEDVRTFHEWATIFLTRCKNNQWIDLSRSMYELIQHFESIQQKKNNALLPTHIFIVGFHAPPPQLQRLFSALKNHCVLETVLPKKTPHTCRRIAFDNTMSEIETMVRWAKKIMIDEPKTRIGCITPQLTKHLPKIERTFESLKTHSALNRKHLTTHDFHHNTIATSTPLINTPIIYTALKILNLNKPSLELNELGHLLRSPFLAGGESEMTQRAALDFKLRDYGERLIDLRSTLVFARQTGKSYSCPAWVECVDMFLKSLKINLLSVKIQHSSLDSRFRGNDEEPHGSNQNNFHKNHNKKIPPSAWAEKFLQQLNAFGWPGERPLNDAEKTAKTAFYALLKNDFAHLDTVLPKLSLFESLKQLNYLASKKHT